jgi:hypothetical protein
MGSHVGWTKRQQDLIEAVLKAIDQGYKNPLKHASDQIRMSYGTAKNTMLHIRNRYDKMRQAIDQYSIWRRKLKGRRYL